MRGNNPIRKPETGDGSRLQVQHVFATLQGEGPFAGVPAVFVRLGGCNLACGFCDTEFESFYTMDVENILADVESKAQEDGQRVRRLVVITGGEPLRQPIGLLCGQLIAAGFKVQVETNGTLYRELPAEVDIVCSPKVSSNGYHPIRPDLLARVNAFKFIISGSQEGYGDVVDVGQSQHGTPVYVQPMDEYDADKNSANFALAKELALRHGYRMSLQLHKILGIE